MISVILLCNYKNIVRQYLLQYYILSIQYHFLSLSTIIFFNISRDTITLSTNINMFSRDYIYKTEIFSISAAVDADRFLRKDTRAFRFTKYNRHGNPIFLNSCWNNSVLLLSN